MQQVKIGDFSIPVTSGNIVEMTNEMRRLKGRKPLPEDMTKDNLKISWNSEEYKDEVINIAFLGHLQYDILVPYPQTAWMGSILPDNFCTEIHTVNYYQKINGDCELTHAIEDLYRTLKPGGKAFISVPNFDLILDNIRQSADEVASLKWEHFLFSRNVDEKGLFYNQSICNYKRLSNRLRYAKFRDVILDNAYGQDCVRYLSMEPDAFDLPGVNAEVRAEFWKMIADDNIRRKKCIMDKCEAKSGQKEFKRERSVYCRRHYRKAKLKLAEAQEKALRIMVIATK